MVLKKSNGCDSVIILTVKSAKDPNITITEQNKLLMINLPLSSVIYQWFLDEKAILGATNSSFTAISDGVYYLEITDLNACKFKSNSITIKKSSTSDAMQENIRIAPNPMQEQVTISADFDIEKVEITNAMGQILFSQNVANQSITINTVAFAKGVYFAKIYRHKKEFKILILKKQT
jgi:Secretion system C-terminal sorting domain